MVGALTLLFASRSMTTFGTHLLAVYAHKAGRTTALTRYPVACSSVLAFANFFTILAISVFRTGNFTFGSNKAGLTGTLASRSITEAAVLALTHFVAANAKMTLYASFFAV
jgi:hypothetical protein